MKLECIDEFAGTRVSVCVDDDVFDRLRTLIEKPRHVLPPLRFECDHEAAMQMEIMAARSASSVLIPCTGTEYHGHGFMGCRIDITDDL